MNLNTENFNKANNTLFTFKMTNIPEIFGLSKIRSLILDVTDINIPGLSISSTEMNWQGGFTNVPISNISFEYLTLSFLNDVDLEHYKLFLKWLLYIHNNKDKYGVGFNDIITNGRLTYFNNWLNKEILVLDFLNIWPISLGGLSLSTKVDGSEILESSVTFSFDRFEIV